MNDNAINRAIVHTHFVITSMIAFCLLVITLLTLSLCSGVHLKTLKLGSVTAEQLYLKWDKALYVNIAKLTIEGSHREGDRRLESLHRTIAEILPHAKDAWIGGVKITALRIGDINGTLLFSPYTQSSLALTSKALRLQATFSPFSGKKRTIMQIRGSSDDFNASVHAEGVLNLETADLYLAADARIADDIALEMGLHAGSNAIRFNLASARPFKSIAPLVNPLHLHPETRQWIVQRAQGGPLMLHTLRGTMPYNDPGAALEHLYAHVTFDNARYRFANDPDAFEPVTARRVEVLFHEKRLDIIPVDAVFYGQNGGSTWLNIDFGTPDPILNLYLNLSAALTPPLQRLIASYGITLPFVQTEGVIDTALTLNINLENSQTNASGQFQLDHGTIDFSGFPIDINDTAFSIENANVAIHALKASIFDGNVTADITGHFNPAKENGMLHFRVHTARFGSKETGVTLAQTATPLRFDYRFRPDQDRLLFASSAWSLRNKTVTVGAFDAPFDYGRLRVTLPEIPIALDRILLAHVCGTVKLSAPSASLDLRLDRIKTGSIHIADKAPLFHIDADPHHLALRSASQTRWTSDGTPVTVGPIYLEGAYDALRLRPVTASIQGQLAGRVAGKLDLQTQSAELNVSEFHFDDKALGALFASTKSFRVYIVPLENEYDIIVPAYNMLYSTEQEGWKLHFFSLQAFAKASPLLNEYNLTQSSLTLWSNDGEYPIDFKGEVEYPYALMLEHGKPVTDYRFSGRFEANSSVVFTINNDAHVHIGDNIRIETAGIDFNLPELIRFYREHHFKADGNVSDIPVAIDANDTAIVFADGRSAKADAIAVQYKKSQIHAQLYKGKGGALLEVKKEGFYLYGNDLDDDFMEHIFKFSKFKGGTLDFYVIGDRHDFSGLVRIEHTTVYDYVLLNNLFAFINTVPALVTFSLPSYASEGIKIDSAYADLKYHDGNLTVSGIKIDSKEMDFAGQGVIDYNTDTMKMELSVKTQAGKNIRKIPLVGYILVGDDHSVLTTVNVSGPLENPKISSTIAKDIVVTPFNIIKRTLNFPLHYLEQIDTTPAKKKKKNSGKIQITSGTPPAN